jgi:hypothetical protein
VATIAGGCGGGSSDSEPVSTEAAANSYRETFGERPYRCETGYDDWNGDDVTYCYSKNVAPDGHPWDTGCYVTETGQDITVALRNVRDSTDIC